MGRLYTTNHNSQDMPLYELLCLVRPSLPRDALQRVKRLGIPLRRRVRLRAGGLLRHFACVVFSRGGRVKHAQVGGASG